MNNKPIYSISEEFVVDLREIISLKNNMASGLVIVYKTGRYAKFQSLEDYQFDGLVRAWTAFNS